MVECGNGMLGGGGVEVKVWILTLLSSTEREKEKYLIQKIYQHILYDLSINLLLNILNHDIL